ncbi:MAG TPA: DUF2934 domain-containing protein [Opitutaceae bacterium]|jgi:hypothetical protein
MKPKTPVPMPTPASTPSLSGRPEPTHGEISDCARRIWENSGRPEGIDTPIWLEAERRLRSGAVLGEGADSAFAETRAMVGEASDTIEDRMGAFGGPAESTKRSPTSL